MCNTRFVSVLFSLALAVAPLVASAALREGPYWFVTNSIGQATITDFDANYSGAISIPRTLGVAASPVTTIGSFAFGECPRLTSVTIPDTVTSIGANAFYMCSGLISVTIPNQCHLDR